MPLDLLADDEDAIGLDALVDALEADPVDVRDEAAFASWAPLLARLGRNRTFLADLAIAELERRCAGQRATSAYGPQVFLLTPPNGHYVVRANFWPARSDAVVRASGTAPFFYDMPHDHNFPFLTYGYEGPGYWSDYYLFDGAEDALPGDPARLHFVERSRLSPGRLMLYRAHRDVHLQLPPDAFSVSLNILGYHPGQAWRSQYRFDVARDTVAEGLTVAPGEVLATVAAALGGDAGVELAHHLVRHHPSARMRRTALDAWWRAAGMGLAEAAADDRDPALARYARQRLDRLQNGG